MTEFTATQKTSFIEMITTETGLGTASFTNFITNLVVPQTLQDLSTDLAAITIVGLIDKMKIATGLSYGELKALVETATGPTQAELTSLKTDLTGLKTDLTGLKTDLTTLKTDLTSAKNELKDLETPLTTAKNDLTDLKEPLTNAKDDLINLKEPLTTLGTNLTDVTKDLNIIVYNLSSHYNHTPISSITNTIASSLMGANTIRQVLAERFDVLKFLIPLKNFGDACQNLLCASGAGRISYQSLKYTIQKETNSTEFTDDFQRGIKLINAYSKAIIELQPNNTLHSPYVALLNNEATLINKILSNTTSSTIPINPTSSISLTFESFPVCKELIMQELDSIKPMLKKANQEVVGSVVKHLQKNTLKSTMLTNLNNILKGTPCETNPCSALYADEINGSIDNINICIQGYES